MPNLTSTADSVFQQKLESFDWPPSDFNHKLHIWIAYIYLCQMPQEKAFQAMRSWTLKYLAHHNVPPMKYHETLTRAWMLAVKHFMERTPSSVSGEDFIEQNPIMLDAKIMLTHYSKSRLFSDLARKEFIEPDLDPIPRYPDITPARA